MSDIIIGTALPPLFLLVLYVTWFRIGEPETADWSTA
jgi:hypothetical protein